MRRNPVFYTGRKDDLGLRAHPWVAFDGKTIDSPIWLSPDKGFARTNAGYHGFVYTVEFDPARLFPETPLIDLVGNYLEPTELGRKIMGELERGRIFPGVGPDDAWEVLKDIDRGEYDTMETGAMVGWLKAHGYDSMAVSGDGPVNVAVFDPSAIRVVSVESATPGHDRRMCVACARRNPPGDEGRRRDMREAEASGDPTVRARALQARVRSGELHPAAVSFAARLGEPAALLLHPDAGAIGSWTQNVDVLSEAYERLGARRFVSWLLDCTDHVMNAGPRTSIGHAVAVTRTWTIGAGDAPGVGDVTAANRASLRQTGRIAAFYAVMTAHILVVSPHVRAASNGRFAWMNYALHALEASDQAAQAALRDIRSARGRRRTSGSQQAWQAEAEFQRQRLAQYVLGEAS